MAEFSIFETQKAGQKHCPVSEKNNERHLYLVIHNVTKLSQYACLFNTHIQTYAPTDWHTIISVS